MINCRMINVRMDFAQFPKGVSAMPGAVYIELKSSLPPRPAGLAAVCDLRRAFCDALLGRAVRGRSTCSLICLCAIMWSREAGRCIH